MLHLSFLFLLTPASPLPNDLQRRSGYVGRQYPVLSDGIHHLTGRGLTLDLRRVILPGTLTRAAPLDPANGRTDHRCQSGCFSQFSRLVRFCKTVHWTLLQKKAVEILTVIKQITDEAQRLFYSNDKILIYLNTYLP